MAVAKFRVKGKFNGAEEATVEINRDNNLVTVRPLRQRTTFALPLADVAESIIWRCVKADADAKRKG